MEKILLDNYSECIHYVYHHMDPVTKELVYIGHGCKSRAWIMGTSIASVGKYGHRKEPHQEWLERLTNEGFTPADWVVILFQNLTKSKACQLEQDLIRRHTPRFNSPLGKKQLILSAEDVTFAKDLREEGMSYYNVAKELGVSTMCLWRAINGKNKNANE